VILIFDDSDINVDDITALKHFFAAGDAVAHHVVDRGADGFRKPLVVQGGRYSLLLVNNIVVADPVQLFRGHTRFDVFADHFKNIGSQSAGYAHFFDFFGSFNRYLHFPGFQFV